MADNPRVFLDIAVSFRMFGRIVIELFADTNPLTAENFRALCTGEKGIGEAGIPLHYKGSIVDGISSEHVLYCGEFHWGERFWRHDRPGILSMANNAGNPNRSQFLIHTKEAPDYDELEEHVAFGQVVSGFEVISIVEKMFANEFLNPSEPVIIADCGQIFPE